ncbi:MAG: hypothetical protein ACYDHW_02175 [Syntrophorhabdaceae bacterium]
MKRLAAIFLICVPSLCFGATAQCPRYSVSMQGTIVMAGGISYTERLEAHKASGGSGYDGRWQVDVFEQITTYPWPLNYPIATDNVHDLGNGVTMRSVCNVTGNMLRCHSTSDTMFLEVIHGRVRMGRTQTWHGTVNGNTMTWKFHIENPAEPVLSGIIAEGPKDPIELTIVKPRNKARYVYSTGGRTLEMELEVKTKPEHYADSVQWTVPELAGVDRTIMQGSPTGRKLDVIYKTLPENNSQFGRKTVTASLQAGSCTVSETREVQFFYPRDVKNNPGGLHYNWFYYWKQTPAAKPYGQLVNIEFGGTQFDACKDFHVPAMFKPAYMYKTIHVCDLTQKLDNTFEIFFPAVKRSIPATVTVKNLRKTRHIDTFAVLMLHEYLHFNAYHTWREGKTQTLMEAEDADRDGIPDNLEPDMKFDAGKFQTYWGNDPQWKKIGGDEEFLAYEAMYDYKDGTYDSYDWGKPGKNWQ